MKLPSLKIFSIFIFFSFSLYLSFFKSVPFCQAVTLPTQEEAEQALTEPAESLESFHARTLQGSMIFLNTAIGGTSSSEGSSSQTYQPGAVHVASNYITTLVTNPPASSVEYLADLGSRLKLVSPAYAQDGYDSLTGILDIWKAFRNIAYAFFVVFFVVVGFMIMLRSKLNPQTVVNLQLALPKLIITLILITFSYAIAGFILDLINLSIFLIVNLFNQFVLEESIKASIFYSGNFFKFFFLEMDFWDISKELADIFADLIQNILGDTNLVAKAAGAMSQPLVRLIVGGAILFSLFKLLFQLIIAYVNILIQIIFSPIILLLNALPNLNTITSWLSNIIANAAAFPATVVMILIGASLVGSESGTIQPKVTIVPSGDNFFSPPLLTFLNADDLTNLSTKIIGLGIILLLPQVVKMIQEALKVKPSVPAGQAMGAGLAQAATVLTAPIRSHQELQKQKDQTQYQAEAIGEKIKEERPGR